MAVDFPSNPNPGDTVTDDVTGTVWMWDGVKWTFAPASGGGGGQSPIIFSPNPPANPAQGGLWWNTDVSKLYVFDGGQWIVVINTPEGAAGGGGLPPGVTDGSDAAPGDIGEYVRTQYAMQGITQGSGTWAVLAGQSIDLSAGDWDVVCLVYIQGGTANPITNLGIIQLLSTQGIANTQLPPNPGTAVLNLGNGANSGGFTLVSQRRWSTDVPITVTVWLQPEFTGSPSAGASFEARRMR